MLQQYPKAPLTDDADDDIAYTNVRWKTRKLV